MSCGAVPGGAAWMRAVTGERMERIANNNGAGPARA